MHPASLAQVVEAAATVVGSAGVIAALLYSAQQTRALSKQARLQSDEAERNIDLQRGNLELRLMELTISIDRIFLERPHLRRYFYENRPLRRWGRPRRRAEVVSVAEILIDFVDSVAGLRRHGQISDRNYENWRVFTESYYQQSPAIRELWHHWGEFYLPETAELFAVGSEATDPRVDRNSLLSRVLQRLPLTDPAGFPRFSPESHPAGCRPKAASAQSPGRDSNS